MVRAVPYYLPPVLGLLALAIDGLIQGHPPGLGRLDAALFAGVVAYVAAGPFVLRDPTRGARALLLIYSVILTTVLFEAYLRATAPAVMSFPWVPGRRVATVAGDPKAGIGGEVVFTVNRFGLRAPEIWPRRREDRILCVGGSTTECFLVTDRQSWPWLLGDRLTEAVRRPILVGNAGRSGQMTLHHEYLLEHYPFADQFGIVIVLCGINDVGALLRGNYANRAASVEAETLINPKLEGAFYRRSRLGQLIAQARRHWARRGQEVIQDPRGSDLAETRRRRREALARKTIRTLPHVLDRPLDSYAGNLTRIVRLCRRRGQTIVLMTQPTLYHAGMPDELALLLEEHTDFGAYAPETLGQVMGLFNDRLIEVARREGTPYIDLAARLPKDESVFYDDCHFNVGGCRKVVAVLGPLLIDLLDRR